MHTLTLRPNFSPPMTEIFIGRQIFKSAQFKKFCTSLGTKIIIIADETVHALYGASLAKTLHGECIAIPSGEEAKTKHTQEMLLDKLFQMHCDKETVLIAVGGGITTDLVGFVASIYKRGLSLVLIPTTLLAIVDAAIGGKTSINTPFGKNLIGTLHYPKAIFVDLATLATLPATEWINGVAEILKLGLVFDAEIWEMAKKNNKDPALIARAIQGKIDIVEQDPIEKSMRRILNFGHTIGHALETLSNYEMPHGQAVAIGTIVESHLSMRLGFLSSQEFISIQQVYRQFLLTLPKNYTREALMQAFLHDKKNKAGEIRFVCIDKIGHAVPFDGAYVRAITAQELEPTLLWMEQHYAPAYQSV